MDKIVDIFFTLLPYVLGIFVIYCIFQVTISFLLKHSVKEVLIKALIIISIFSFMLAKDKGAPSCVEREYDVHGSICVDFADNSYEVTSEDRINAFLTYLVFLYSPVILACFFYKVDINKIYKRLIRKN